MSNPTIINGMPGPGRPTTVNKKGGDTWKVLTIAGVSGVLFGTVSYAATRSYTGNNEEVAEEGGDVQDTTQETAFTTDGHVEVATNVNDDMTFAQAFHAAREDVGAGGVFVWHGGVYGTYTADEWNSMSEAEHNAFYSHIDYGHLTHDDTEVASTEPEPDIIDEGTIDDDETAHEEEIVDEDDVDIDPLANQPIEETEDDGGITIYEVSHDVTDDTNTAFINVDGQDAVLVDVDNDQVFDVLVSDFNNDGEIDDSEVVDITESNISVDDLGGFTDGYDGLDTMI